MRAYPRSRVLAAAGASLLLASLSLPVPAHANGRMAAGHQLVVSPVDSTLFVMETTFGLLISHDSGSTFGWVCESPIGYGADGVQDPSIGVTSKFVLAGIRQGLSLSPDNGCSWSFAVTDPVIDVVVRPDDPHTAYALSTKFDAVSDAGENLFTTKVLVTHDDGATWTQQGATLDPKAEVETIDVATGDPNRIYIGGARLQSTADGGVERVGLVLVSTDAGATYAETTIALNPANFEEQGSAYVSAVDPTNPDRVYVRIGDGFVDRLLISDDSAATFRTGYQGKGALLGFALSADGSRVFVGGPLDGVVLVPAFGGDAGAAPGFTQQSSFRVSCLSWIGGKLYACMGEPAHPFVQQLGVSTDDGASFATRFPFGCIAGPLACLSPTATAICNSGLPLVRASIGVCDDAGSPASGVDSGEPALDAGEESGASDGGESTEGAGDGGTPAPPGSKSGCGCESGETASAGGLSALALFATMVLRRRQRAG